MVYIYFNWSPMTLHSSNSSCNHHLLFMASYQVLASFYFWYQLEFMVLGGSEMQSNLIYAIHCKKEIRELKNFSLTKDILKKPLLMFYARGSSGQKVININKVLFDLEYIYWRMKGACMVCCLYSKQKKYCCKNVDSTFLFVCLLASSILHSI